MHPDLANDKTNQNGEEMGKPLKDRDIEEIEKGLDSIKFEAGDQNQLTTDVEWEEPQSLEDALEIIGKLKKILAEKLEEENDRREKKSQLDKMKTQLEKKETELAMETEEKENLLSTSQQKDQFEKKDVRDNSNGDIMDDEEIEEDSLDQSGIEDSLCLDTTQEEENGSRSAKMGAETDGITSMRKRKVTKQEQKAWEKKLQDYRSTHNPEEVNQNTDPLVWEFSPLPGNPTTHVKKISVYLLVLEKEWQVCSTSKGKAETVLYIGNTANVVERLLKHAEKYFKNIKDEVALVEVKVYDITGDSIEKDVRSAWIDSLEDEALLCSLGHHFKNLHPACQYGIGQPAIDFASRWASLDENRQKEMKTLLEKAFKEGELLTMKKALEQCICKDCKSGPARTLINHMFQVHGITEDGTPAKDPKPFKCTQPECSYEAKTKGNLNSHMFLKHVLNEDGSPAEDPKPFKCTQPECSHETKTRGNLNSHMFSKHGLNEDGSPAKDPKPYKCTIEGCDYAGKRKYDLDSHMKTHTQRAGPSSDELQS